MLLNILSLVSWDVLPSLRKYIIVQLCIYIYSFISRNWNSPLSRIVVVFAICTHTHFWRHPLFACLPLDMFFFPYYDYKYYGGSICCMCVCLCVTQAFHFLHSISGRHYETLTLRAFRRVLRLHFMLKELFL